jgi:hypothetical protein
MPATTSRGYPYPLVNDPVSVHTDIQKLAEAINTDTGTIQSKTYVDRNDVVANAPRVVGNHVYTSGPPPAEYLWDGSNWVMTWVAAFSSHAAATAALPFVVAGMTAFCTEHQVTEVYNPVVGAWRSIAPQLVVAAGEAHHVSNIQTTTCWLNIPPGYRIVQMTYLCHVNPTLNGPVPGTMKVFRNTTGPGIIGAADFLIGDGAGVSSESMVLSVSSPVTITGDTFIGTMQSALAGANEEFDTVADGTYHQMSAICLP